MKKHLQPQAPIIATEWHDSSPRPVLVLVVQCPHCERAHHHGGGTDLARARQYLGHRAAHCDSITGYQLTDPHGTLP